MKISLNFLSFPTWRKTMFLLSTYRHENLQNIFSWKAKKKILLSLTNTKKWSILPKFGIQFLTRMVTAVTAPVLETWQLSSCLLFSDSCQPWKSTIWQNDVFSFQWLLRAIVLHPFLQFFLSLQKAWIASWETLLLNTPN